MTTTGQDIITQASKKAGIIGDGRALSASEAQDALADLNDMMAEWNTQRFAVWHLLNIGFTSDGRTTPYTVGPGGDFNVSRRPDRIESAFLRQLVNPQGLNVDTPIQMIPAWEEYSMLSLKTLSSFTLYGFLDSSWPLGNLHLYPWPNASVYATYIQIKDVIPVIELTTDLSTVPDQYMSAMKFNLAKRLRMSYGLAQRPDIDNMARHTLNMLKDSNLQIPELVMPRALIIQSSGYNILSDQFGNG